MNSQVKNKLHTVDVFHGGAPELEVKFSRRNRAPRVYTPTNASAERLERCLRNPEILLGRRWIHITQYL